MSQIKEGELLWEQNETQIKQSNIHHYISWLKDHKQLKFDNYHSLWQWLLKK